jgi:hypothetical protein
MTLPGAYPPTVNESQTITAAQPGSVDGGQADPRETRGFRDVGAICQIPCRIERS